MSQTKEARERHALFEEAEHSERDTSSKSHGFSSNGEVLAEIEKELTKFSDLVNEDNEGLARDDETLDRIEGHVDAHEDLHKKAKYLTSSMSFWGRIKNLFVGPPKTKKKQRKQKEKQNVLRAKKEEEEKDSSAPSTTVKIVDADGNVMYLDAASTLTEEEKAALNRINGTLDNSATGLKQHSAKLDEQKARLDTIHSRSEAVADNLKKLNINTRMMSR